MNNGFDLTIPSHSSGLHESSQVAVDLTTSSVEEIAVVHLQLLRSYQNVFFSKGRGELSVATNLVAKNNYYYSAICCKDLIEILEENTPESKEKLEQLLVTAIQLNIKFSSTETQRIIEAFLRSPIEIRKISLISTFIIQFQITLLPKQIVHILATLANQAEETCVEELLQNTINRYLTDIRLLNSPNPFPIFLKELSNCLILWAPRVFFLKVFEELRKKINHLPDKKIILEPLIKEILQYENKDRVNEIISMMLKDSFYFPILYELANSNRDLDIWLPKSKCDLLQSEEPMFDFPPSPRSDIDIAVIYPELEINENFNI